MQERIQGLMKSLRQEDQPVERETVSFKRQEIAEASIDGDPREVASLRFLQRLAALPRVEGIAFSRMKGNSGLHFTTIERNVFLDDEEGDRTFDELDEAIDELGHALNEKLPGCCINMKEGQDFKQVEECLRRKDTSRSSGLDLIEIIRFE